MKKQALILICALTAGSFLQGCSSASSSASTEPLQVETQEETTAETVQTQEESASAQDETQAQTDAGQAQTEAEADSSAQEAELRTLFDRVKNLESGTAGSSLKLTGLTADICDFCAETDLKETELEDTAQTYMETELDDGDERDVFKENWQSGENTYRTLIDPEADETDLLTDAGRTDSLYPYGNQEIAAMETLSSTIDAYQAE